MKGVHMNHPKTAKNLQLNIAMTKFGIGNTEQTQKRGSLNLKSAKNC